MSKFSDKIKNNLTAWLLVAGIEIESKYTAMLVEAVARGDLHILSKGLDGREKASDSPLAAFMLKTRKLSVINACKDRANFKTARQVITMGYGDVISRDEQRKMLAKILLRDENAFNDSEAISFCEKMELPADLEKDGKHLSQFGRRALEHILMQRSHPIHHHASVKNLVVIQTPQALQTLSEVYADQETTGGLSARLSKTEQKKDPGQYPKHNPKSDGR